MHNTSCLLRADVGEVWQGCCGWCPLSTSRDRDGLDHDASRRDFRVHVNGLAASAPLNNNTRPSLSLRPLPSTARHLDAVDRHNARHSHQNAGKTCPCGGIQQPRKCTRIAPLCKEAEGRQWQRQDRTAGQDGEHFFQLEPAGTESV